MKIVYLESNINSSVIKFIVLNETIYWSIVKEHRQIAELLGEDFCIKNLQGAGIVMDNAFVWDWESEGFQISTPSNLKNQIQDLFNSVSAQIKEVRKSI